MCYYLKSFNIPHVINHTVENTVIGFVLTCLKFDFYKRWRMVLEMIEKKKRIWKCPLRIFQERVRLEYSDSCTFLFCWSEMMVVCQHFPLVVWKHCALWLMVTIHILITVLIGFLILGRQCSGWGAQLYSGHSKNVSHGNEYIWKFWFKLNFFWI